MAEWHAKNHFTEIIVKHEVNNEEFIRLESQAVNTEKSVASDINDEEQNNAGEKSSKMMK